MAVKKKGEKERGEGDVRKVREDIRGKEKEMVIKGQGESGQTDKWER